MSTAFSVSFFAKFWTLNHLKDIPGNIRPFLGFRTDFILGHFFGHFFGTFLSRFWTLLGVLFLFLFSFSFYENPKTLFSKIIMDIKNNCMAYTDVLIVVALLLF